MLQKIYLLLFCLTSLAVASDLEHQLGQAQIKAREQGLPILLALHADWCGSCKEFDEVRQSEPLRALLDQQVVFVYIDYNTTAGEQFRQQYGYKGMTHFVFVDVETTQEVFAWVGYEPEIFPGIIADMIEGKDPIQRFITRLEQQPSHEHAAAVANMYKSVRNYEAEAAYLEKARRWAGESSLDYDYLILQNKCSLHYKKKYELEALLVDLEAGLKTKGFTDDMRVYLLDRAYWKSRGTVHATKMTAFFPYLDTIQVTRLNQQEDLRSYYYLQAVRFVGNDPKKGFTYYQKSMTEGWRKNYRRVSQFVDWCLEHKVAMTEAAEVCESYLAVENNPAKRLGLAQKLASVRLQQGDKQKALATFELYQDSSWWQDGRMVNSYAWWCFEQQIGLDRALTLGEAVLPGMAANKSKRDLLDTLAEIYNLQGKPDRAVAYVQRALEIAPKDKYLNEQLARFTKRANQNRL